MLDPPSEILLEMLEPKDVAVNGASVERFLYQNVQIAHAKHRNGALPADPDVILPLRDLVARISRAGVLGRVA